MSESKEVAPTAAVEAAREQLDEMGVFVSKKYMRAALEAAAPHLMAQAWDEGYITCETDSPYKPDSPNPYGAAK